MARTLKCDIVTPEKQIFSEEASFVSAPSVSGEVGILPLHAAYVSALKTGQVVVKYPDEKNSRYFVISGGYLEVKDDEVIILADSAIDQEDIVQDGVQKALDNVQDRMNNIEDHESELYKMLKKEYDFLNLQLYLTK